MNGIDYRIEHPSCKYCLYATPPRKSGAPDGLSHAELCNCIIKREAVYEDQADLCECYYPDNRDIKVLDNIADGFV